MTTPIATIVGPDAQRFKQRLQTRAGQPEAASVAAVASARASPHAPLGVHVEVSSDQFLSTSLGPKTQNPSESDFSAYPSPPQLDPSDQFEDSWDGVGEEVRVDLARRGHARPR